MSTSTPETHARRLAAVRGRARDLGIDHVVVYSGEDMSYLTSERMDSHERLTALVVPVDGGAPLLVLPSLELTDVTRRAADRVGATVHPWSDGTDAVALVTGSVAGRVAVSTAMPALHLVPLQAGVDGEVVLASEVIEHVRSRRRTRWTSSPRPPGVSMRSTPAWASSSGWAVPSRRWARTSPPRSSRRA